MSAQGEAFLVRAADLRRAFDRSFAEEPAKTRGDLVNLLAIRVGADDYALRLAEITGLFVDPTIVAVPSPLREFLGLAGLRGGIVPVYGLRALLGDPPGGDPPRFLVVAHAGAAAIGLAFDAFEGYQQVEATQLLESQGEGTRPHAAQAVRLGGTLRGILGIPSLVEAVRKRVADRITNKEH